jgi:hypothetical protein
MSSITKNGNDIDPGISPKLNYKFFNGTIAPYIISLSAQKFIIKRFSHIINSNNEIPDMMTKIISFIKDSIIEKLARNSNISSIIISSSENISNNNIISTYTSILAAMVLVTDIWYVSSIISLSFEHEINIYYNLDSLLKYDIIFIQPLNKNNFNYIMEEIVKNENKLFKISIFLKSNNTLLVEGISTKQSTAKIIAEQNLVRLYAENPEYYKMFTKNVNIKYLDGFVD